MAWHVLLIGCPTGGLMGVDEDIERMYGVLRGCGVPAAAIYVLRDATAAAIHAALANLVARVGAGDDVLLYYSGHGLRLDDPDTGESAYAIVPVVPSGSPAGTFHYVLHEELSAYLWRISEKPANATWVADCCHATGIFRGEQLRGLAPRSASFSDHRARILAELPGLDPEGNPSVVRVCACAKEQLAFGNEKGGYLTQALAAVLAPFKRSALPLANLQALLVAQMRRRKQRPVIAGPIERAWLTSRPAADVAFQTLLLDRGGRSIAGGHALDQRAGDQYIAHDRDGVPHLLTLTEIFALRARAVESDSGAGAPLLPAARLWSVGSPRAAITIGAELPLADAVALTASGYVARAGETEVPIVATVGGREGAYTLCSQRDGTVRTYSDFEPFHRAVHGLARQAALLARATPPPPRYTLTFDVVRRELVVVNLTGLAFYVTVLALHVAGPIALVNRVQPDGEVVGVAHPYRVQVPLTDLYAVVVIATSLRLDLRGWTDVTASHLPIAHRDDGDWCGIHAVTVEVPGVESPAA